MRLRYRAFLSYSHKDSDFAIWLHRELERWRIDAELVGRETAAGLVPKSLRPIFRDRDDFAGGASLKAATEAALSESDFLVVVCSENAAASAYVDAEVRFFKALGRADRVIPVILAGEPGDDAAECFPPSVKHHVGSDGALADELAEPIAADAREQGDGRHRAAAKVAAGLLGLSFDEIARREEAAQRRRMRLVSGVAGCMAALAVVAVAFAWLAETRRVEAVANYEAAKSAAGALLEGVAKDLSGGDATLPVQRRMLARANGIYDALKARAPDDLEVVGSQAQTLFNFAAAFRDQEDWAPAEMAARQSEELLSRLIGVGDKARNWTEMRAIVRMMLLITLERQGKDETSEAATLKTSLEDEMRLLREIENPDMHSIGMISASYLRESALLERAGDYAAAALVLDEAVKRIESYDAPFFLDGQETHVASAIRIALKDSAKLHGKAGAPEKAIEALTRLEAVHERILDLTPETPTLRNEMFEAAWAKADHLRRLGNAVEAARAERRAYLSAPPALPWREPDAIELRAQAEAALEEGEKLLTLGSKDAVAWLTLCAAFFERMLSTLEGDTEDGLQMIRCMAKAENAAADNEARADAIAASIVEAEALGARFPALASFAGMAHGRKGEYLREQGDHSAAAQAFAVAAARFEDMLLADDELDLRMLSLAAESHLLEAESRRRADEDAADAYAAALSLFERGAAADPDFAGPLARALEIAAKAAPDRSTWIRVRDLLLAAPSLNDDDRARLDRANAAISE